MILLVGIIGAAGAWPCAVAFFRPREDSSPAPREKPPAGAGLAPNGFGAGTAGAGAATPPKGLALADAPPNGAAAPPNAGVELAPPNGFVTPADAPANGFAPPPPNGFRRRRAARRRGGKTIRGRTTEQGTTS